MLEFSVQSQKAVVEPNRDVPAPIACQGCGTCGVACCYFCCTSN